LETTDRADDGDVRERNGIANQKGSLLKHGVQLGQSGHEEMVQVGALYIKWHGRVTDCEIVIAAGGAAERGAAGDGACAARGETRGGRQTSAAESSRVANSIHEST
jgi:hypothetical protein